ncbi:uncharacterized protein LOC144123435 [Amblyomma americanum]
MPDATNADGNRADQPNSQDHSEARNTLPSPLGCVTLCSQRQLQDAHVTLLCPCPRPSTADTTMQAQTTEILTSAPEPAQSSTEEEHGVGADAQLFTVSDELPSIYHRSKSRSEQVSKQFSANPRRG